MGEQKQEKEEGLEFLNIGSDIKEFVKKERGAWAGKRDSLIPDKKRKPQNSMEKRNPRNFVGEQQRKRVVTVAILLAAVLCTALCGTLWLKVPAVTVLLVIVLEEILALCLRNTPVWLHGLVVAGNIALGAVFGMTVFLLLANLVYLAEIGTSHYQRKH